MRLSQYDRNKQWSKIRKLPVTFERGNNLRTNDAIQHFLAHASFVVLNKQVRRLKRIVVTGQKALVIDFEAIDNTMPTWICTKTVSGQTIINITIDYGYEIQALVNARPAIGRAKKIRLAAFRHCKQAQAHGMTFEEVAAVLIKYGFNSSWDVIEWSTCGCEYSCSTRWEKGPWFPIYPIDSSWSQFGERSSLVPLRSNYVNKNLASIFTGSHFVPDNQII